MTLILIGVEKLPTHSLLAFFSQHMRKNWGKEIGKTCQNNKNKKKIIKVQFWRHCRKFNFWSMARLVLSGEVYQNVTPPPLVSWYKYGLGQ